MTDMPDIDDIYTHVRGMHVLCLADQHLAHLMLRYNLMGG